MGFWNLKSSLSLVGDSFQPEAEGRGRILPRDPGPVTPVTLTKTTFPSLRPFLHTPSMITKVDAQRRYCIDKNAVSPVVQMRTRVGAETLEPDQAESG
jgi:hypothetical protein